MKLNKVLIISKVILIVSLISLAFTIGLGTGKGYFFNSRPLATPVSSCNNMTDLPSFSMCLHANFTSWYVYNLSNVDKSLTEDELRIQGGVCSHASNWYISEAKQLGYYGATCEFRAKDMSVGHVFAVLYDVNLNEYCILDQQVMLGCVKFSLNSTSEKIITENGQQSLINASRQNKESQHSWWKIW
jgi:hypothetical protein